jgi:hypothetical protein
MCLCGQDMYVVTILSFFGVSLRDGVANKEEQRDMDTIQDADSFLEDFLAS